MYTFLDKCFFYIILFIILLYRQKSKKNILILTISNEIPMFFQFRKKYAFLHEFIVIEDFP